MREEISSQIRISYFVNRISARWLAVSQLTKH